MVTTLAAPLLKSELHKDRLRQRDRPLRLQARLASIAGRCAERSWRWRPSRTAAPGAAPCWPRTPWSSS